MIELTRILCPIDFSPFSERALKAAVRMAQWYGATVDVLHVIPRLPPSTVSEAAPSSRTLAVQHLNAAVELCRLPGVKIATELVESEDTTREIIEGAERFNADLIVTGSHGRSGVQRVLFGSVVEALLHTCRRPVLTIPSHVDPQQLDQPLDVKRIVCGVDFAAPSVSALAFAFSIAEEANAKLTLLHAIEMPPELKNPPQTADDDIGLIRAEAEAETLTRLRALVPEHARDYCTVQTDVLEGGASRQILREAVAQNADLIVLGVHGRNAFDLAFFGSTSKDVIRYAQCPVLIVPVSRHATMRAAS
jgi:nucleotide-binding universal stress UspA family protein